MNWLNENTSLYNSNTDNKGRNEFTFKDILFSKFGVNHEYWDQEAKVSKTTNDLETIIKLGKLDRKATDYEKMKTKLKNTLQAFTPAGLLKTREAGKVEIIKRTGIAQIDFDGKDNPGVDMKQLKKDVFNAYEFIAFAGMSCSGDGFYALVAIAEPDMLEQYIKQLFWFFSNCNILVDTTKGKNVHDLRYVSYDSNMLYREDPEPLKINTFFKRGETGQEAAVKPSCEIAGNMDLVAEYWLRKLKSCVSGNRWRTIQAVASALGSKRVEEYRFLILQEIETNPVFEDERKKFLKAAKYEFEWGWKNPMKLDLQAQ